MADDEIDEIERRATRDRIAGFVSRQLERGCHSMHLFHCDEPPAETRSEIFSWISPGIFGGDVTALDIASEITRKSSIFSESSGGRRHKFEIQAKTAAAGTIAMTFAWNWPPTSMDQSDLDSTPSDARAARIVHVFAAHEDQTPEVSIVVSGKFPRAAEGDLDWSRKHMEQFRSDARALEEALVTTLPGGTLHQLTSLLLSRRASQLVVRDFAAPPDTAPAPASAPVPMLLHCPECSARHVDEGEFATKIHHTHACQSCGLTWRPAIVPTVGVRFLPGFRNDSSAPDVTARGDDPRSEPRDCAGHDKWTKP